MVRARRGTVRTFSVGSPDLNFDESAQAAVIARHLGTTHTALTVTAKDALNTIESLPEMYDEPFADSSQIPTFLISKLTRQYVTVACQATAATKSLADTIAMSFRMARGGDWRRCLCNFGLCWHS